MDTQRETVGQVNATVLALSGTVDRLNEAAGAVGALDGRLDTLTGIVAPLVPCILELRWRPALLLRCSGEWRDYVVTGVVDGRSGSWQVRTRPLGKRDEVRPMCITAVCSAR